MGGQRARCCNVVLLTADGAAVCLHVSSPPWNEVQRKRTSGATFYVIMLWQVCLFGANEVSLRDAMREEATDDELAAIISAAVDRKKVRVQQGRQIEQASLMLTAPRPVAAQN